MLVTKINTSHPAHIRLRHCLTNRSATLTMAITLGCMHCANAVAMPRISGADISINGYAPEIIYNP